VSLPKVFAVPSDKKIRNNSSVSYNKSDNLLRNDKKVRELINKIFKRSEQIYSIDCTITLKDGKKKCTIIGATTNHLEEIYDISL